MLEQTSLLLRPWNTAPSGKAVGCARAVEDGSGTTIGFVRETPARAPLWLRWLAEKSLQVYEEPDQSLVFALRRGWGWPGRWHVVDADERLIGTVRGRALLDGFGILLGVIEPPDVRGRGRFVAIQGRELGEYAVESAGTRVTFASEMEGNPFAKMMLLGAVLVSGE